MAQFTTTNLMGGGVLVEGTDDTGTYGKTVLLSDTWNMVQHVRKHEAASEVFDSAVKEMFAPITEAAEAAKAIMADPADQWGRVVISEGTDGTKAESIELDHDGVVLRMLEESDGSLLRWVDDILVIVQP